MIKINSPTPVMQLQEVFVKEIMDRWTLTGSKL